MNTSPLFSWYPERRRSPDISEKKISSHKNNYNTNCIITTTSTNSETFFVQFATKIIMFLGFITETRISIRQFCLQKLQKTCSWWQMATFQILWNAVISHRILRNNVAGKKRKRMICSIMMRMINNFGTIVLRYLLLTYFLHPIVTKVCLSNRFMDRSERESVPHDWSYQRFKEVWYSTKRRCFSRLLVKRKDDRFSPAIV